MRIEIDEQVTIGGQPTAEALRSLADEGFEAVIDLRTGEGAGGEVPLPPEREAHETRGRGLEYHHFPLPSGQERFDRLDALCDLIGAARKPCYVHSHTGQKAAALVAAAEAIAKRRTGEWAVQRAEAWGAVLSPALQRRVREYVEARRPVPGRQG